MKRYTAFLLLFILLAAAGTAQQMKYTSAAHAWNADSLGNHRAVVVYSGNAKAARVIIGWRRRDAAPRRAV